MAEYFQWRFTASWCAHIFKAMFKQHHKELREPFEKFLGKDAVIFDVGAHSGQLSKLFSKIAPDGTIYCVEPGTYARTILRVALWWNKCRNCLVLPFALDNTSRLTTLSLPEKRPNVFGFGLTHLSNDFSDHDGRYKLVRDVCATFTLDEVVTTLGFERLDFIKADIEGFELNMLQGAQQTIDSLSPVIYLEINDDYLIRAGTSKEKVWDFMTDRNYIPYFLDDKSHEFVDLDASTPRGGDILWAHHTKEGLVQ